MACVVGDGEAETGPLAASWHSNKFLNPGARRRGASDPAPERLQDRRPDGAGAHPQRELEDLFRGYGYEPYFVEGDEPAIMHQQMAARSIRRGSHRDPADPAQTPGANGYSDSVRAGR